MLRITENEENGRVVRLRLDGAVSAEAADELWQLCARYQTEAARNLVIDMEGVNFMSPEAARKLARMRNDSLRVINCSPFVATLLDTTTDSD
jgi:anti-anti-sigma regulatory factor